jgi:hypothetical protein
MKDLIKALQESLKREQERQEALRKHIKNGGCYWGYSGYEFDKACDEAEDRLRKVLEGFVDARLGEILATARQREERTEQEAREIADSSGMSLGLARKFVTVDMTPEQEPRGQAAGLEVRAAANVVRRDQRPAVQGRGGRGGAASGGRRQVLN